MMTYVCPQSNATAAPASSAGHSILLQRKSACSPPPFLLSGGCADCQSSPQAVRTAGIYPLEEEADRVTEQVLVARRNSAVSDTTSRIQRFCGQSNGQMDAVPASVDRVLSSLGSPLEPALRQDMEQRFGRDFSSVRVHSGAVAEQSARDVNANAYTVGQNIVFGTGRFAPNTYEGRRLMAHELTHVTQQSWSAGKATARYMTEYPRALPQVSLPSVSSLTIGPPDDRFEQDADQVADAIVNSGYGRGRQFGFLNTQVGRYVIRRQETPASHTREEQHDRQLRQLARFPRKALEQWKTLKVKERDAILQEMTRDYGEDFKNDFTEYAFGIKKPNLSGTILQSTPKELIAKGYRYTGGGDVWVHPSGHEIFLLSPAKRALPPSQTKPEPESESDPPQDLAKCADPCVDKTENAEDCQQCCENTIPDEEKRCLWECEAACDSKETK